MGNVELNKTECKRCGYKWLPRQLEVRQCPSCRSCWWDMPKEIKEKKNED